MTERVSFRFSSLTLKEDQEEVPTLLRTKDGRLSGAVRVTHLHKCTHTVSAHALTLKHKKTLMRDSYCTPLTILCLGKKNINLPSLKASALLSHLRPT